MTASPKDTARRARVAWFRYFGMATARLEALPRLFGSPLESLARRLPVHPQLLLFGARRGTLFGDCSADLFLALSGRGWRCVWATRRPDIQRRLSAAGRRCVMIGSWRHRWILARARAVVLSSQATDISDGADRIRDDTVVVFTGHGKSSKASALKANYHSHLDEQHRTMGFLARRAGLALASSRRRAAQLAECHAIPKDRISVTGYPRTDKLLNPALRRESLPRHVLPQSGRRILYAPTWRKHDRMPQTRLLGFADHDAESLIRFLEAHRFVLFVRPHIQDEQFNPALMGEIAGLCAAAARHVVALPSSAVSDINSVLGDFDALITDYSSIDDDFLLTDRPILYAPYDRAAFARVQGFIEDYAESRAGPVAQSQAELLDLLRRIAEGDDPEKARRAARRDQVHDFNDGQSTARAIAAIEAVFGQGRASSS